jgi:Asp-tRNA(Asn)/Glu-tRNA(Gln) amidotransferase A subunit family amidase
MYINAAAALAGLPQISGLPIGLGLVVPHGRDELLLEVAHRLEFSIQDSNRQKPA